MKNLLKISRNNDYTTGNLLDQLIIKNIINSLDLLRQTISQHINFRGKLEDDGATRFFTAEKQQKNILNFYLDSLIVTE